MTDRNQSNSEAGSRILGLSLSSQDAAVATVAGFARNAKDAVRHANPFKIN
jgi:hypothetical protein